MFCVRSTLAAMPKTVIICGLVVTLVCSQSDQNQINSCRGTKPVTAVDEPRYLTSSSIRPDDYFRASCLWLITTAATSRIKVTVMSTHRPAYGNTTCDRMWLSVYDGASRSSPFLLSFRGQTVRGGPVVVTSTNQSWVEFIPRNAHSLTFNLQYQAVDFDSSWEYNKRINVTTDAFQEISSLYYPYSFPTHADCYWLVVAPPNHRVQLDVVDFYLRGWCRHSFVRLYDGTSASRDEIATLCGVGRLSRYFSTASYMYITFQSADTVGKGFKFRLIAVPRPKSEVSIGGVVGGVVGLVAVVVLVVVVCCVRRSKSSHSACQHDLGAGGVDHVDSMSPVDNHQLPNPTLQCSFSNGRVSLGSSRDSHWRASDDSRPDHPYRPRNGHASNGSDRDYHRSSNYQRGPEDSSPDNHRRNIHASDGQGRDSGGGPTSFHEASDPRSSRHERGSEDSLRDSPRRSRNSHASDGRGRDSDGGSSSVHDGPSPDSDRPAFNDLPPAYRVAVESDLRVDLPPVDEEPPPPPPYTDSMLESHPPSSPTSD